jgi:thiol-disulfide isomerase/thioredoxin
MQKSAMLLLFLSFISITGVAQKTLENVEIRTLDHRIVRSGEIHEKGRPMLLVFWATWCSHTKDALTSINDDFLIDWQDEFDLQLVAVSVDDTRNLPKVKPLVYGKGWEFDVYVDANSDFNRVMNVNNAPFFLLLNGKGEVVWQHNSYAPGDEETIYEELLNLNL